MKQGDRYIFDIVDYGSNGEGVAKQDGFVVFIPFALRGEKVKCRITYVNKNFADAVLEEVISSSPYRIKPECNRFGRCGGCDVMQIAYEEQLRIKKKAVENVFAKNTKLDCVVDDCVPSDKRLGYRNKVSLPFGVVENRIAVGFYRENTHKIVSITKCFLQGEWIEGIIGCVLKYANSRKLSVYDDATGKGLLRHLVVRKLNDFYMITLVSTADLPDIVSLTERLNKIYGSNYVLYNNLNKNKGNVVLKGEIKLLYGSVRTAKIRDIVLEVNPFSFFQVNDYIRDKIYDRVSEIILQADASVVIDAYAGVGVLGADLAKKHNKVYNIEIVPEAVKDAEKIAEYNGVSSYVTSICGDSAIELPSLIKSLSSDLNKCAVHSMKLLSPYFKSIKEKVKKYELRLNDPKRQAISVGDTVCFNDVNTGEQLLTRVKGKRAYPNFESLFDDLGTINTGFGESIDIARASESMLTIYSKEQIQRYGALAIEIEPIDNKPVLVLDPPRKGCDSKVIQAIKDSSADTIIYISCNPATLSRDIELLSDDYTPSFITPYDMFPCTRHVEVLTLLTKK